MLIAHLTPRLDGRSQPDPAAGSPRRAVYVVHALSAEQHAPRVGVTCAEHNSLSADDLSEPLLEQPASAGSPR
jgi:hypothetical protein